VCKPTVASASPPAAPALAVLATGLEPW